MDTLVFQRRWTPGDPAATVCRADGCSQVLGWANWVFGHASFSNEVWVAFWDIDYHILSCKEIYTSPFLSFLAFFRILFVISAIYQCLSMDV